MRKKLIYNSIKTTISVISGFVKDFEIVAINDAVLMRPKRK